MANILGSPTDISQTPWTASGTGVSVTSATTLQTGATGTGGLNQVVTVIPGATYTFTATIQGSKAAGDIFCAVYPLDFSTTYGEQDVALTTSAQNVSFSAVIPSGVTSAIYEFDLNSNASAIVTFTNLSLSLPSSKKPGSLCLVGVGT